jgi:threonine dehydratase
MFTLSELEDAQRLVHQSFPGTPQFAWPLLAQRCGAEVWVKHENHTPTGAFKLSGGGDRVGDTRQPWAVPGLGGPALWRTGHRRRTHRQQRRKERRDASPRRPPHRARRRLRGGTGSRQRFSRGRRPGIRPILRARSGEGRGHLGSGICGAIRTRDLLGLKTEIVGVQAAGADCYAQSFAAGRVIALNRADTLADGMAVRQPDAEAFAQIEAGASRIVTVTDNEIAGAIRAYWTDTHNLVEGAGAAPLAALLQDGPRMAGKQVGLVVSGGNIDLALFRDWVLSGR